LTPNGDTLLDARELAALLALLHEGSAEASRTLGIWIGKPSVVEIDALEHLPLEEATTLLSTGDDAVCFCRADMHGHLTGPMILVFDDVSGLALADMLLELPRGTTREWTEMATSAALETANILFCAYLNSLCRHTASAHQPVEVLPSPPTFGREFPESLLEFALMAQAARDHVILARTRFELDANETCWTLLFVPDTPSMERLRELLSDQGADDEHH
jgi:chemotaxis protein CheC